MSDNTTLTEFMLTITLNAEKTPQFNYTIKGSDTPVTGSFVVDGPTTIRYNLIDNTEQGLAFAGAAFTTPFDNVIDSVELGNDGEYIDLIDSDAIAGKTGFRFILSNQKNNLMITSPDPEIINRGRD